MKRYLFLAFALFFSVRISNAQTFHDDLTDVAVSSNLVGMSVVTTRKGAVTDIFHYGKADIGRDVEVNNNTKYRIASISKTVTATALMILYEQGHFQLDDPIHDFLGYNAVNPNFPEKGITFRMLLSHTSSLQDGSGYSDFLTASYNQVPPPNISELLLQGGDYYTTNMWRTEQPGTHFTYSNSNYAVIGTLIEKISGKRFDIFVQETILDPLEIDGSFNVNLIDDIHNVSVLYRNGSPQADNYQGVYPDPFDGTKYEIGSNGLVFSPQGGLRVSALDLAKLMMLHSNYGTYKGTKILDSTTVALMHTPQWTYDGSNGDNYYNLFNAWGLGLHITTNRANGDIVIGEERFYGHPGEAYGLISDMYFDKEKDFWLIFITNGYYGSSGYPLGNSSAFYLPEEESFKLIDQYHYQDSTDLIITNAESIQSKVGMKLKVLQSKGNIEVESPISGQLHVYSLTGALISSEKVCAGKKHLCEALSSGMYVFKVVGRKSRLIEKVLLK